MSYLTFLTRAGDFVTEWNDLYNEWDDFYNGEPAWSLPVRRLMRALGEANSEAVRQNYKWSFDFYSWPQTLKLVTERGTSLSV